MSAPVKKLFRLFPLWAKQTEFLDSQEPIKGFVSGQGAGKTMIGAYDLCSRVKPGRTYMVTAPTYKVMRQSTMRSFHQVARYCGRLVRPVSGEDFMARLRTFSGGEADVLFRSTEEPDHLRGPNLSGAWMDEASFSPYEAFQILIARLREGGERGWLDCTFTPQGMTHWTYEVFAGKKQENTFLVQAHTADNPFLAPEFVEMLKQTYAGLRAEQELGGQFVNIEGAEWPAEYFPDSIWRPMSAWPTSWRCSALALDPALGEGERGKPPATNRPPKPGCYAAFVFVGVDQHRTLWVDAWMSQSWDSNALVKMGLDLLKQTEAQAFCFETNGGQAFLGELFKREARDRNIVIPLFGINNDEDKEVRIRSGLTPFLAQGRLRFNGDSPGAKLLVAQLRDFPVGIYRDGPDALQQAIVMADWLVGHRAGGAQPRAVR